ncbi:quinon protein alcohol dehydrogenase-like superfamily [Aspergillus multicolor]|uniref:WD40 repeat domain-containing protein n=1 Tax=Aspergillus multicolor TaxID=41759 RepID=UPI003CCCCD47
MRPHTREEFQIAIVCALPDDADAVKALFDETYDTGHVYGKQYGDANVYTNGRIGQHDVVLTYMPGMGRGSGKVNLAEAQAVCPDTQASLKAAFSRVLKANDAMDQYEAGKLNRTELDAILVDTEHKDARRLCKESMDSIKQIQANGADVLAFSHDGAVIACAWRTGVVRLWQQSSERWHDVRQSQHATRALGLSLNGSTLAIALDDRFLRLWDERSGRWKAEIRIEELEYVLCVSMCLAPDGRSLLLAGGSRVIRWTAKAGRAKAIVRMGNSVSGFTAMTYSTLFDAISLKRKRVLKGHKDGISCADISANDKLIASASSCTVRLWDAETGTAKYALKCERRTGAVAGSPGGQAVAVAFEDGTLRLWDTSSKVYTHTFTHGEKRL